MAMGVDPGRHACNDPTAQHLGDSVQGGINRDTVCFRFPVRPLSVTGVPMRRPAFYSTSRQTTRPSPAADTASGGPADSGLVVGTANTPSMGPPAISHAGRMGNPRLLWAAIAALALLLAISAGLGLRTGQRTLTQDDIDAAVLKTLETTALPSAAAKAYETIQPSVVRVTSYMKRSNLKLFKPEITTPSAKSRAKGTEKEDPNEEVETGVGTGVVIVDKGIILTNLHVVHAANRIVVTFADGLESEAYITGFQAEDDLAVLQAKKIPDDLIAATMRSTANLAPGEQVLAVGFPFGIGPSASAGVVSGLKRSFRSPQGKQEMTNLIQFDAAANPGNSGGPLITMEGEVVGIVTAILNPTSARTFIGIGFAVPIENAASAAGLPPF